MMVNKSENRKKEIELLQTAPDLTAIVCDSTRLPYVECDIETCDDQVLVYENNEMAEKEAKKIEDTECVLLIFRRSRDLDFLQIFILWALMRF